MTIDEAKRLFAQYIDYDAETPNYYDMEEACKVAIKALEQEPKPSVSEKPNNCDLISRKALISHIENQSREWGEDYDAQQILGDIEDMPSVKPQEPKTGHWIFDEILDKHYYCSECKSMGVTYWDYCPYCGTKMIEPNMSENPTSSKPEISSYYGLKSYVRERSEE